MGWTSPRFHNHPRPRGCRRRTGDGTYPALILPHGDAQWQFPSAFGRTDAETGTYGWTGPSGHGRATAGWGLTPGASAGPAPAVGLSSTTTGGAGVVVSRQGRTVVVPLSRQGGSNRACSRIPAGTLHGRGRRAHSQRRAKGVPMRAPLSALLRVRPAWCAGTSLDAHADSAPP